MRLDLWDTDGCEGWEVDDHALRAADWLGFECFGLGDVFSPAVLGKSGFDNTRARWVKGRAYKMHNNRWEDGTTYRHVAH